MSAGTILIIEDDQPTRFMVKKALASEGYRVLESEVGHVGMHLFNVNTPDLVILDVELPDANGFDLCRKIRAHKSLSATPVIMLTGQSKPKDKQEGFEAGADQYLVKPLSPAELILWVEALFRRQKFYREQGEVLQSGDLHIDSKSRLVRYGDKTIEDLTGREFDLLYFLVSKRPNVISRETILGQLWKTVAVDKLVDAHMSHLRKKLPQELADKIQNVPGKGFRFLDDSPPPPLGQRKG